jgi:hypothetical protein
MMQMLHENCEETDTSSRILGGRTGEQNTSAPFPQDFGGHIRRQSLNSPVLSVLGDRKSSVMGVVESKRLLGQKQKEVDYVIRHERNTHKTNLIRHSH